MAKRTVPLESGERDTRVTIEAYTEAISADGLPLPTWATLATVYAKKNDLTGTEKFEAGQLSAPFDTRWEMAYRTDMDPDSVDITKTRRLVYAGRTFDIVSVSMIGRREGVEIMTLTQTRV